MSNATVVAVTPVDIFRVNPYFFTGYLILGLITFVIGVGTWIAFHVQLGTSDRLVPVSKRLLVVAIVCLCITVFLWTLSLIQYIRIFRFRISSTSTLVVMFQVLVLILLGLVVRDFRSDFLECVPPKYRYSPDYDRCVPVCPAGYFLDTDRFICIPGCNSDSDCTSPSEVCAHGKCCDLSSHTLTSDGQCCPNKDVIATVDGTTVCCPSGNVCGDQCCLDPDAVCDPSTMACRVPCGVGGQGCAATEMCLEDPAINLKQCVPYIDKPTNSTCEIVKSSTIPDLPNNAFFPAVKNVQGLSEDALACNPYDKTAPTNCRTDILRTIQSSDPSVVGYTCGLSSPVQFKSTLMKGDCNTKDFIAVADPVLTDRIRVIQVDDQHFIVNQRLDALRGDRTSPPSATCVGADRYTQECGVGCKPEECPFQHDSKQFVCEYANGVGTIKDITIQSRCDVSSSAPNPANRTTWTFLPTDVETTTGTGSAIKYGNTYFMRANDESSKFNQMYLSARGTTQAPNMDAQPWAWRVLPYHNAQNENGDDVRTGDVFVLQSLVGSGSPKYDRAYISTKGTYHQPSMNFGEGMSSVEDGLPTATELWMVYDDTYKPGRLVTSASNVYIIKYAETPDVPFTNMAISLTGGGSTAPYMMGHVRSLTYQCSDAPKDPRNVCPQNGKCIPPTLDTSNVTCSSISGETRPLLCKQFGKDNVVQGMCCDTKNFQRFLNDTPNFSSDLVCDTDGNDTQTPIYGDSRHRMFCSTPQTLPLSKGTIDVGSFNRSVWQFNDKNKA